MSFSTIKEIEMHCIFQRDCRPKKIQSYAIKETSRNESRETLKCPICTTILEQTVQDRSKTIYKKRLCYGCLEGISKEHKAKSSRKITGLSITVKTSDRVRNFNEEKDAVET